MAETPFSRSQRQDAAAAPVGSRAGARYVIVPGAGGVRTIVRLDGLPLGTTSLPALPAGAPSYAERLAAAQLAAETERVRVELALRERLRRERERRAGGAPLPSAGVAVQRRGRADGWRPADRGAFARRLGVDGLAVRDARRRAGLSQRELARRLLVARSVIGDAETGRRNVCPALARWAAQVLRAAGRPPRRRGRRRR